MRRTQHGAYLHQLTRYWVMNMYLVQEEDGLTLIDSGMSGSAKAILGAAERLGDAIRRVVLTHAHSDHAGSFDALRAALPRAEFVLGERTADFLAGDTSLKAGEAASPLRGGYITVRTTADRLVTPGAYVGSLRVVGAPGHSPDQLAFFDERDGTLVAGDAFQTQGGFAVSGVMRWRFPLPALATWDLPTAVETARELAAMQPERLALGHGPVLEKPGATIAGGIAEAERKLDVQTQAA